MNRPLVPLLAMLCLAQFVFAAWPGIDIAVSRPFHDGAHGTWRGAAPALILVREAMWLMLELSALCILALFANALVQRGRAAVPARLWGFAVLAIALGPGLVVNGVLKASWGRARPRGIEQFGGGAEFTPALQIADECAGNCSFVAGEVAGAATLALIVWLIVVRRIPGPSRRRWGALLALWVALSGVLRIAAGAHFLSDVVFAVLVSAIVTLGLWHLMDGTSAAGRLNRAALAADLSNGRDRLLALARRQPPK